MKKNEVNQESIMKTRLIIVDDHKIVRDGIISEMADVENVEIIGEAEGREELFVVIKEQEPDIILLDMFLPKPEGISILRNIKDQYPDVKVIILSANIEEDLIAGAFKIGAEGYLDKNIDKIELLEAINCVTKGEYFLSNSIKNTLSQKFISTAKYGDKYVHSKIASLSEREINIIRLFSEGLSYKEIANELNISTRTVESHKVNILGKLELKNVIEVVKYAIKNKIVDI